MPTVAQLAGDLAVLSAGAASWDRVGLQLGDPASSAERIGVCHEVTDAVVDETVAQGIDFLVVYHPLLFSPTTSLIAGSSAPGRAHRLISAGVALYVVHTGWDTAAGGTSDALAAALGLTDATPFGADDGAEHIKVVTFVPATHQDALIEALSAAGAGTIGDYTGCAFSGAGEGRFVAGEGTSPYVGTAGEATREPEQRVEMIAPTGRREAVVRALMAAHPYEEPAIDVIPLLPDTVFIGRLGRIDPTPLHALRDRAADALGFDGIRTAGDSDRLVSRVAVVPGSGSSFMGAAIAGGADVLITGDVGHHRAVEANSRGLSVLDVGHIPGERPGLATLYAAVRDRTDGQVVDLTDINVNPWETL